MSPRPGRDPNHRSRQQSPANVLVWRAIDVNPPIPVDARVPLCPAFLGNACQIAHPCDPRRHPTTPYPDSSLHRCVGRERANWRFAAGSSKKVNPKEDQPVQSGRECRNRILGVRANLCPARPRLLGARRVFVVSASTRAGTAGLAAAPICPSAPNSLLLGTALVTMRPVAGVTRRNVSETRLTEFRYHEDRCRPRGRSRQAPATHERDTPIS